MGSRGSKWGRVVTFDPETSWRNRGFDDGEAGREMDAPEGYDDRSAYLAGYRLGEQRRRDGEREVAG